MKNNLSRLLELAENVKEHVKITPSKNKGSYFNFVFLCGGMQYENDNRTMIKNILARRDDIRCLYSESLFENFDFDLLTLEELLLESSTNVVIIIESFGSACELGAFSYTDKTLDKLIVINDIAFKGVSSFINDGPIKKIENNNHENVFYEEFKDNPVNSRRNLIISSKLIKRLLKDIPKEKTFKQDAILINDGCLIIKDLVYFQIVIFEIIKFFGPLKIKEIVSLLKKLYNVENISFEFLSGNKINSSKNEIVLEIIKFLLVIQEKFGLLCCVDERYSLHYSSILSGKFNFLEQNSLLFRSRYLNSKEYFRDKSEAIRIMKKRGIDIWEH